MMRMRQLQLPLFCLLALSTASSPDVWNVGFDERQVTHPRNDAAQMSQPTDVTVLVPRPGAGRFLGFMPPSSPWFHQLNGSFTDRVSVFLGVPYAAKPLANLRFRLPRPAYLDSRGTWIARQYGHACLQNSHRFRLEPLKLPDENFSEDCLYLNLFVPGNASNERREKFPVLINIHGGTLLVSGAHAYPGQILATKGIVVATFTYRLNIFGLISTGNFAAPGNLALWDQRAALMWIRDSVEHFGGDPARVTLSGESAGSSSVGLHIISNERLLDGGRPLFHQAIMMSGADIANWALSRPGIGQHAESVSYIGEELGCLQAELAGIINCLRCKPAAHIDRVSLDSRPGTDEPEWLWAPVVDGALIDDIPLVKRQSGEFQRLPIMGGFTRDDTVRYNFPFTGDVRRHLMDELTNFGAKRISGIETIVNDAIRLYLGNNVAIKGSDFTKFMENITRDLEMIQPVFQVLRYHSAAQLPHQPVFLYEFNFEKPSYSGRVKHGDDLDYILGIPFVPESWWKHISMTADLSAFLPFMTDEQRRLSDFMMTLWANFVKFSDPTPQPVHGFKWKTISENRNSTGGRCALLNLPERTLMNVDYKGEEMRLWQRFYESELQFVLQLNSQTGSVSTGLLLLTTLATAAANILLMSPI